MEPNKRLTLQQLGWVVATELRLYKNAFFLGFETGGATGDQAEDPSTYLNYRWKLVPQPTGDRALTDFKFSPDYHVDEILFRRIIGTVTNAVYVKPQMTYWLDLAERRQVGLSAAFIYSMAVEPVSTPGNAFPYGVEMNLGLNYRNPADGFYGGVTWGVLWPLGALNRPQTTSLAGPEPLARASRTPPPPRSCAPSWASASEPAGRQPEARLLRARARVRLLLGLGRPSALSSDLSRSSASLREAASALAAYFR